MGIRKFDLDIEGPAPASASGASSISAIVSSRRFRTRIFFPDMELSYVLPDRPQHRLGAAEPTGRLIVSAGQVKLNVSTWNMMAFDCGVEVYKYMLANNKNMVDMLIAEADTGINIANFDQGRSTILVDYGRRRTALRRSETRRR